MVSLEKEGPVFILYLPVALNPINIEEILNHLKTVENNPGPTSLILTSKHRSIFNAGMDLKYMNMEAPKMIATVKSLMKLLGSLLWLGVPTVSAISGHCIAGGCALALASDYRIMSKGTLKMNELEIGLAVPEGVTRILRTKLTPRLVRDLLFKSQSISPTEALERGAIDEINNFENAKVFALGISNLGDNKAVYRQLKRSSYLEAINLSLKAEVLESSISATAKAFGGNL